MVASVARLVAIVVPDQPGLRRRFSPRGAHAGKHTAMAKTPVRQAA